MTSLPHQETDGKRHANRKLRGPDRSKSTLQKQDGNIACGTRTGATWRPGQLLLNRFPEFKKVLRGGGFLRNWVNLLLSICTHE